jgi:hypothetical protein
MNETTKGFAYERAQKILDAVSGVAAQYGIHSKDKEFLQSLIERGQRVTSAKQDKWLTDLEHKVTKGIAP